MTASEAAASPSFPAPLLGVASRVEGRVDATLADEMHRWGDLGPDLREALEALRDLVGAGGKRLRPAFCHVAFVGAGGDPQSELIIDAAAALELVHTFALVHDDVMDGSDQRRGENAVHRRFILRHEGHRWRGEPRRFGEGMAILVGDFAVVFADRLMRDAPRPARAVFDELRIELCIGQALDLAGAAKRGADVATARRITRFKSAKYTVERPLHMGAALAGRLDELESGLSAVGRPLGEAFQLRDDILGLLGDESVTGKPVGDDLREAKPTPLFAIAMERADPAGRALLARMGAPDLTQADVDAARQVMLDTGAVDVVEAEIERLVDAACEAVDRVPLDVLARRLLAELATYVAWRDR